MSRLVIVALASLALITIVNTCSSVALACVLSYLVGVLAVAFTLISLREGAA